MIKFKSIILRLILYGLFMCFKQYFKTYFNFFLADNMAIKECNLCILSIKKHDEKIKSKYLDFLI